MTMKNKIPELIERLGISAYQLAGDTGISRNTIYMLKKNPTQFPSKDVFDKIITKYQVTPNDLVEWVPDDEEGA